MIFFSELASCHSLGEIFFSSWKKVTISLQSSIRQNRPRNLHLVDISDTYTRNSIHSNNDTIRRKWKYATPLSSVWKCWGHQCIGVLIGKPDKKQVLAQSIQIFESKIQVSIKCFGILNLSHFLTHPSIELDWWQRFPDNYIKQMVDSIQVVNEAAKWGEGLAKISLVSQMTKRVFEKLFR